ncbi:MAG: beta-ketoacyl-ACP synthase II [Phycisphaerales bacterium]|nr:beta-ketoacyl-ACP synthase II [Phycisphaerales bacterium]
MSQRRIVVTGLGAVTPLGASVAEFWDGLISARAGISGIAHFDAAPYDSRIGGYCGDFDMTKFADQRMIKRMDRFAQLAYASALMARDDGHLTEEGFEPTRSGVIMGAGLGGLGELEESHTRLLNKGPSRVSAFTIPKIMGNSAVGHISIGLNFQAINTSVATACASAGNAMGDAFNAIRFGFADIVMTGGSEATLTPLGIAAFAAMKALSTRNDDPTHASRPFDKDRDGFVLSEGAGTLIFEELEHARRRGATIYCEVIGYGATADASDMVQPDPQGSGAGRAMRLALRDAKLNPEDVQYINAHGTSTPLGDLAETNAIKGVFGAHARNGLLVSSTKGATGHLLGASGGIEAIACVKAIQHNTVPPTINLENPDEGCDLDYVPNEARDARVNIALSNSFGFGGHNACVIFRRFEG